MYIYLYLYLFLYLYLYLYLYIYIYVCMYVASITGATRPCPALLPLACLRSAICTYPAVFAHTRPYSRMPAYSRILAHTRAYLRIPARTREYPCILAHARDYSRIPRATQDARPAVALSTVQASTKYAPRSLYTDSDRFSILCQSRCCTDSGTDQSSKLAAQATLSVE